MAVSAWKRVSVFFLATLPPSETAAVADLVAAQWRQLASLRTINTAALHARPH